MIISLNVDSNIDILCGIEFSDIENSSGNQSSNGSDLMFSDPWRQQIEDVFIFSRRHKHSLCLENLVKVVQYIIGGHDKEKRVWPESSHERSSHKPEFLVGLEVTKSRKDPYD